jgi:hypothetical protein
MHHDSASTEVFDAAQCPFRVDMWRYLWISQAILFVALSRQNKLLILVDIMNFELSGVAKKPQNQLKLQALAKFLLCVV